MKRAGSSSSSSWGRRLETISSFKFKLSLQFQFQVQLEIYTLKLFQVQVQVGVVGLNPFQGSSSSRPCSFKTLFHGLVHELAHELVHAQRVPIPLLFLLALCVCVQDCITMVVEWGWHDCGTCASLRSAHLTSAHPTRESEAVALCRQPLCTPLLAPAETNRPPRTEVQRGPEGALKKG